MTRTAVDIAAAVRGGALTARAATEEALARIAERDTDIGAFQLVRVARALAEADAVDVRADRAELPLAGVPVAVKDNVPVTGEPMRDGSAGSDPAPQTHDHPVVDRLRAAGAVVVGLTRVPELCVFGATDSVFGVTHNPWNLSKTPGGSSGGSAAAVAAGMVPAGHGNDGMGSIRIPAACCGLVGIKPGLGTVPSDIGNGSWFDMAENGPLATSAADCALMLSVLAAKPALAEAAASLPTGLRVAVSVKAPAPLVPVDAAYAAAARAVGEVLSSGGHEVQEAEMPYTTGAGMAGVARWFAGAELDARQLADRSQLEKRVARHAAAGRAVLRAGLVLEKARTAWQHHAENFFAGHDVLLTPTLAQLPIAAERWGTRSWRANLRANTAYAPFASPWNLAGWPAIAVPAGLHPGGMPLSVQLVARPGGEALLLGLAGQIEQLMPWPRTAPAYS